MCTGSQEQFCSLLRIGCSLRPYGRLPVIFASFLKDGHLAILGGISARFVISGQDVGEQFALVEHPMEPHALAAPMHRHHRENEYTFVLEGRRHHG